MTSVNEELWFGAEGTQQALREAERSAAAMVGRVLGARPFPVAAQRLLALTGAEAPEREAIVAVLEADSALSARLLRLVNSPGYALKMETNSISHAVSLIGMDKLHQLACTASILDMYDSTLRSRARVLEHGAAVGALARRLAVHLALPPDVAFTCGFLHDIGKIMLLDTEGDRYEALLVDTLDEPGGSVAAERELWGFDHAMLASQVLAAWKIPAPVPQAIGWHHQIASAYQAGPEIASLTCALRLANDLAHALQRPDWGIAVERVARGEAASYLDVSEQQLWAMGEELRLLAWRARASVHAERVSELDAGDGAPRVTRTWALPAGEAREDRSVESVGGAQARDPIARRASGLERTHDAPPSTPARGSSAVDAGREGRSVDGIGTTLRESDRPDVEAARAHRAVVWRVFRAPVTRVNGPWLGAAFALPLGASLAMVSELSTATLLGAGFLACLLVVAERYRRLLRALAAPKPTLEARSESRRLPAAQALPSGRRAHAANVRGVGAVASAPVEVRTERDAVERDEWASGLVRTPRPSAACAGANEATGEIDLREAFEREFVARSSSEKRGKQRGDRERSPAAARSSLLDPSVPFESLELSSQLIRSLREARRPQA